MSDNTRKNHLNSSVNIILLEERIVLDAAGAAEAAEATTQHAADMPAQAEDMQDRAPDIAKEIVFVDSAVRDYRMLLGDNTDHLDIYILDRNSNAFDQMTRILDGKSNISALHIISHGDVGAIELGGDIYDQSNLADYQAQMQAWRSAMAESADILLYGCQIGADMKGLDFMNQFAQMTDADILASEDLTGAEDLGGDFILERMTGQIEAQSVIDLASAQQFNDLLLVDSVLSVNFAAVSLAVASDAPVNVDAVVSPPATPDVSPVVNVPDSMDNGSNIDFTDNAPILDQIFNESNSQSEFVNPFQSEERNNQIVFGQRGQYTFEFRHSFPLSTNFSEHIIQEPINKYYCMHIDEVDGEIKRNVLDLNYTVDEASEEEESEKDKLSSGFLSQLLLHQQFNLDHLIKKIFH